MINEEIVIEQFATEMFRHQGIQFTTERDARRSLETTKSQIRLSLRQSNVMMKEGLTLLRGLGLGYVSALSNKLLNSLHSSKKLSRLIELEFVNNDQAMPQFMAAMTAMENCAEDQKQSVITVLMALFPAHPQPYVYLGSAIWRTEGIAAAEIFYSSIVDAIENPALDYYAADCLYKNNNITRAKELLFRALQNLQESPERSEDLKREIIILLEHILAINRH